MWFFSTLQRDLISPYSRSSSSAIFERDIEPIVSPSPPPSTHHHQHNPHRIPRAKTTEQLEHSVPSVLDSAATILIGMGKDDVANEVAVVSPAASILEVFDRSSGFASPIGSLSSRSPSPVGSKAGPASPRGEVLLSIPVPPQATSIVPSPASILGLQNMGPPALPTQLPTTLSQASAKPRPFVQTTVSSTNADTDTPVHPNPTLVNYPVPNSRSSSLQSSPRTTTLEQFPGFNTSGPLPSQYTPSNALYPSSINPHPPSPPNFPKKRLSFMSYNDLLSSTPTTTQPLSSLTTCASATEPPPHIPSVSGLNVASAVYSSGCASPASRAPSLRNFPLGAVGIGGFIHPGKRDSIALLDNMGGEWEREGLGKGLEERLDALILPGPPTTIPIGGKA